MSDAHDQQPAAERAPETVRESETDRLAAFSDGVIAVAITLLVLDIRLPEGFGEFSDGELWAALVALWPKFFSYLLSFAVIAVYWMNHHSKFRHIHRVDRALIWINMLFLLTMGIVPFTTQMISENAGTVATAIYAGTEVVSGFSLYWLWFYADRAGLIDADFSRDERRHQYATTLFSSLVFAISIPLSFAHADGAKFFWLLILPTNYVVRRLLATFFRQAKS